MRTRVRFKEWFPANEMTARRSFDHSLSKFKPPIVGKPVAILTAWRGEGSLADNRRANVELEKDLQSQDLGYYPVKGAGQEQRRLLGMLPYVIPSGEESFVVHPRGEMSGETFETVILRLLHKYDQYAAMMKVPTSEQAYLLYSDGSREQKGSDAGPTTARDNYYTQLKGGPRADPEMLRPWETYGEQNRFKRLVNWWSGRAFMNNPADQSKIGRRFSIKKPPPQDKP
ncbi:MAG TPA: hypothetical protein VFI31_14440, partial [Pirellulales bacterium]|nr:hypothetical protein [Pirellulales bacterium]